MSFMVGSMIGITVSYRILSINGFSLLMVRSIFVAEETYLITKLRHFEPTKAVFLANISIKWDSSNNSEKVS
jgi:hypothetical protein